MAYILDIQLLLDVDDKSEAYDAMNEILRGQLREFSGISCLLDYRLAGKNGRPTQINIPPDFQSDDAWINVKERAND